MTATSSATGSLHDRYAGALMNAFGPPRLVLSRGVGCHVWDEEGNRYLDLLGGIAVNTLGHGHPALRRAVADQLATLGHVSNFFATRPQIELAETLLSLVLRPDEGLLLNPDEGPVAGHAHGASPLGKVFFTNSGTEANEAALKLTRLTGRTHLVAADGSFHGRTMGALALTAKAAYREPFEPLPGEVTFVPYGDADALAAAVTDRTAAVVLEPLQGEAGVVLPPAGYLQRAREITEAAGALLWLDEVQTGIGRTGAWFAHQGEGVRPDLVTVAKGLAGGIPVGACIGLGAAGDLLRPGNHGTTFGGNPVAAAAALAVLRTVESDDLLGRATTLGDRFRAGLAHPHVTEVRGRGLLIGLDLDEPRAGQVARSALARGFIINDCTPDRIRLAPPLVLSDPEVDDFLTAWPQIIEDAYSKEDQ